MFLRKNKFSIKDKYFMNLALNQARDCAGLTGKNPPVGCVIVNDSHIVSLGRTNFNGRPHAEFNAIRNINKNINVTTIYISLEPCNHYGVTKPCTNHIIKKKIKKVIYSINDIDNRTKGKSFKILKSKKIQVKTGLLKSKINKFYENYFINRKKNIPFVTGKIAISKNNLIYSEKQRKITNKYSNDLNHLLRYKNDMILISYRTLNKDNPKLGCRINGLEKFSPRRVILDKYLDTKINSYIFTTVKKNNTIIFYNKANLKKIRIFKKKGIKLIQLNIKQGKNFDLNVILKKLYSLGCRNLLVEGGKNLSIDFFNKKLFHQFYLFKSSYNISKVGEYKEFNPLKYLLRNYKYKSKISAYLANDVVYLYKN
jgi:diaminohydroxyphosphoribosylaminopyrimidine deaminase / 5-amino-6-(5-phosphoribosylamino)uracil reductase